MARRRLRPERFTSSMNLEYQSSRRARRRDPCRRADLPTSQTFSQSAYCPIADQFLRSRVITFLAKILERSLFQPITASFEGAPAGMSKDNRNNAASASKTQPKIELCPTQLKNDPSIYAVACRAAVQASYLGPFCSGKI